MPRHNRDRLRNGNGVIFEVDVLPLQGKQFTLPQAGIDCQDKQHSQLLGHYTLACVGFGGNPKKSPGCASDWLADSRGER